MGLNSDPSDREEAGWASMMSTRLLLNINSKWPLCIAASAVAVNWNGFVAGAGHTRLHIYVTVRTNRDTGLPKSKMVIETKETNGNGMAPLIVSNILYNVIQYIVC